MVNNVLHGSAVILLYVIVCHARYFRTRNGKFVLKRFSGSSRLTLTMEYPVGSHVAKCAKHRWCQTMILG